MRVRLKRGWTQAFPRLTLGNVYRVVEIDNERNEIGRVEVFADGSRGCADGNGSMGPAGTMLGVRADADADRAGARRRVRGRREHARGARCDLRSCGRRVAVTALDNFDSVPG